MQVRLKFSRQLVCIFTVTQSFSTTVGYSLYSEKACRVLRWPRQQGKGDISRWSGKPRPLLHPGRPVCCIQRQPSPSGRLLHQRLSASQSPGWRGEPVRGDDGDKHSSLIDPSALQPHQHTGNRLSASKERPY